MVSITKCHQWHVAMENIYNYYQQPLNPCHTGFKQSCFLSSRTTDSTCLGMILKGNRVCGILHHLTSLPSAAGIGDLGEGARAFLDNHAEAGQSLWQLLPIGPVDRALGGSPYCGVSAFAGNELLVDLNELEELGLLPQGEGTPRWAQIDAPVEWDLVFQRKGSSLDRAWEQFRAGRADLWEEFQAFCRKQARWLKEYSLFCAIKVAQGGKPWNEWPPDLRLRSPKALEEAAGALELERERVEFGQWLFFRQWDKFRSEANRRGIALFGDLPIYVGLDSADVWSWQEGFDLDTDGRPATVAGEKAAASPAAGRRKRSFFRRAASTSAAGTSRPSSTWAMIE